MRNRCENKKVLDYFRYGGRGIKVCKRWQNSFENFLMDMGPRPPGKSLDRYPNNNGDYKPSNCRWATREQQGRNMRTNLIVLCFGNKMAASEAANKCGHNYNTLISFLNKHKDYAGDVSKLRFPPLRKLTLEQVMQIRASSIPSRKIAPIFGVCASQIRTIRRLEVWR